MIAVLIASVLLSGFVMLRRAAHFMRLAAVHEHLAYQLRPAAGPSTDPKGADHNEKLARMYQRAATRPWLPVEPDPPPPEP
jgi:hypothetical protein